VGRYVDAGSSGLGVSYLDFVAPGVVASTALQVGVGESTYPVFGAFHWTRSYHAMRASPLTIGDMLRGQLAYIMLRVLIAAAGFLIVLVPFGAVHSPWAFTVLPLAMLIGLASAAPVFGISATISSDNLFAVVFRFAVLPMTLFAGVFFPVQGLPPAARLPAYASPLWHGVELCRAATLGTATAWGVPVHLGVLIAWTAAGYLFARWRFAKRLAD
jgi:lipooligosaccharide transport system permease protein